jgi:alpha-1,4-galacturonosyltransferase
MGGKVVGAIQFCEVKLGQLKAYTEERNFDNNSCVWLSGLNVVELKKWRDLHITSRYDQLLQKVSTPIPKILHSIVTFIIENI